MWPQYSLLTGRRLLKLISYIFKKRIILCQEPFYFQLEQWDYELNAFRSYESDSEWYFMFLFNFHFDDFMIWVKIVFYFMSLLLKGDLWIFSTHILVPQASGVFRCLFSFVKNFSSFLLSMFPIFTIYVGCWTMKFLLFKVRVLTPAYSSPTITAITLSELLQRIFKYKILYSCTLYFAVHWQEESL